jgi:excinuclease UvrABC nuclease subunit
MAKRFTDDIEGLLSQGFRTKGKWLYIRPGYQGWSDLVDQPGCYVIFNDTNLSPVYIGHSNTPKKRLSQHICEATKKGYETPWGNESSVYIKIKYSKKYGQEAMLEKRLIRKILPKFNKQIRKVKPLASWC